MKESRRLRSWSETFSILDMLDSSIVARSASSAFSSCVEQRVRIEFGCQECRTDDDHSNDTSKESIDVGESICDDGRVGEIDES